MYMTGLVVQGGVGASSIDSVSSVLAIMIMIMVMTMIK